MDSTGAERFNFFAMLKDGFKNMTLGKTLWAIIIIKLIIMFFVLRPLFFKNFLNNNFDTEAGKAEYVSNELIKNTKN